MSFVITRKARLSDMPTLRRFEQGVIAAERPFDSQIKEDPVFYYDLENMIDASHIELIVAEIDGEIVGSGYARIENARHFLKHQLHAYLGFMFVDPAHRGKSVNKEIIDALKKWAISQGITEMLLEVYDGNLPAIKAYEKVGFSKQLIAMRMALK